MQGLPKKPMSPLNQVQQGNNALTFAQQKLNQKASVKVAEHAESAAKAELRKDELILSEAAAKLAAALRIS